MQRSRQEVAKTVLRVLVPFWLSAGVVGCAAKQVVPLAVEPRPLMIFLDGEELPPGTDSVALRSGRDHTLFFKRAGYRSQLVVLHSREVDGKRGLVPARVDLVLREAIDTTPSLELEFDAAED